MHADTHTHTHTYTSCRYRDMAGQRDLRRGGSYLWGANHTERDHCPGPQGAQIQRPPQPGQTGGPTPRCRALWSPRPELSMGQHPPRPDQRQLPVWQAPMRKHWRLKTDRLKQSNKAKSTESKNMKDKNML